MKIRHLVGETGERGAIIIRIGQGALVRRRNGTCHLTNGTRNDQTEAKEWISLFMHEAVLDLGNRPGNR